MRLSIIVVDKAVYVGDVSISDLLWEGTPSNIHALQWDGVTGHIEFIGHTQPNEIITELPQWAINAKQSWDTAKKEIEAELLASAQASQFVDIPVDTDLIN
jgi:hypothetical protein